MDHHLLNEFIEPGGKGISSGELRISYPHQAIRLIKIDSGRFFGYSPLVGYKNIEGENGDIVFAVARKCRTVAPTRKAIMSVLSFERRTNATNGIYSIDLEIALADHTYRSVPFGEMEGGVIRVYSR